MRALLIDRFGEPASARIGEIAKPEAGPGELVVQVHAVSLNPVDWKEMAGMLAGFYPDYPSPWVPGFDAAGTVEEVGAGVTAFAPGDTVLIRPDRVTGNGVLAEYAKVPQDKAAKVAGNLSHPEIACIATGLRTAWQGLTRPDIGVLRPGHSLFVHGATGGCGSYALTLGKALGARVAGSCRPANATYAQSLGAELAVDYAAPDLADRLRQWAPEGIDVILDCQMGGQQGDLLDLLAPGGRMVALATLNNDGDVPAMIARAEAMGRSFHFLLMDYEVLEQDMAGLNPLLESGSLVHPEIALYPFDRAVAALEAVKAGGIRGKIVVEVVPS